MARKRAILVVLAGAVVVMVATSLLWPSADGRRNAPRIVVRPLEAVDVPHEPRAVEAAVVEEAEPTANLEEPSSGNNIDQILRSLVGELSNHPVLASWMVNDDLLRRFVGAVEAVASGYSPRDELDFLKPQQPFVVCASEAKSMVISNGSFGRYDLATDVLVSIDIDGAVALYRRLEPLIDEIHREIAWMHPDFEERFVEAIDHLLVTPVPEGEIEVERRLLTYAFAEDELEHLSDAQRQLLRLGSRNARRVQAKLRQLRVALGHGEGPAEVRLASMDPVPVVQPRGVASTIEAGWALESQGVDTTP